MSRSSSPVTARAASSLSSQSRDSNGTSEMDDPENTMATIARSVEQLHANLSSPHEKDLITARLLGLAREKKEARTLIGSHSQAMPLFISVLRNGTTAAKVNVAATISVLCKEEDLRLKVLLGGCIPSLLSLLKSKAIDSRKAAAEALYEVSSGSLSEDHVGVKIFVTEGVVPALWEQLNPKINQDKVVEGFVTGALRNLCGDKDGYWRATLDAGGVDIIIGLLSSDNVIVQSNAASLLARLISAFSDSIPKVIKAGAVEVLLHLVDRDNDVLVRASAADALQSLCSKSSEAKETVVNANGIPILIGAVVAPSKECMQGESGEALQSCAMHALANICGGISELIMYLGELSQAPRLLAPVADIIGSLAYSLMVYKLSDGEEDLFNVKRIEDILVMLLKPRDNKDIQDSVLEALASLYGNQQLSRYVHHAEAKKVLIGLITMAMIDVQEQLISSFVSLCCNGVGIWEALEKREGVQLLISFLGLSGEQHQEYAVSLLAILTDQVDDSKWAITAAGGIPPLVQLLEIGSQQAREDAAHVLWNLCCHSEDIRACVESADAVSALLWLLRSGSSRGQQASAKALLKLICSPDAATVNQLLALLLGDAPTSKIYIISVLGHVLSLAAQNDLLKKGAPANKGLRSLVEVLKSSNEETQEHAASVLADLFISRPDICDSLATDEIIHPCMKLLTSKTQGIATQSARALGALSRPSKAKSANKMPQIAEDDVKPLIELAKTSSIDAAETAVAALANLLSDPKIAGQALAEDIVSASTRVLEEGTLDGKANASRALHQLLIHFPVNEVLSESDCSQFLVNALVDALNAMNLEGADSFEGLEVLALLSRTKQNINFKCPSHIAFFGGPSTITTLVKCLDEGSPQVREKAIEILSHLCGEHHVLLSDLLVNKLQCIASLADRIMNSPSLEVRVGGTNLLVCVMKEHKQRTIDSLDSSGLLKHLIVSLVEVVRHHANSTRLGSEAVRTVHGYKERTPYYHEGDDFEVPDPGIGLSATSALWLLSLISSALKEDRISVMEAGALEVLSEKFAKYSPNSQADFDDTEGVWISALLLAILFQDPRVVSSSATMRVITSLSILLKSDEAIDRYFAAQSLASLAINGNKAIHLAMANSGGVVGLINLLGSIETDAPNLIGLSEEFSLPRNPDQIVLETLFDVDDVRVGSTARKCIPLLVDLLRPIPDRPGAPPIAVCLLTRIAEGNDANKLLMAETGALDGLTKYLSLSPQDSTETTISNLLRILFSHHDVLWHEASLSSLNQLVAVLRLGSRTSRYNAALALHELFNADSVRDTDTATQAIQPLVDMLNKGSEKEQLAALVTLIKLTSRSNLKLMALVDVEDDPLSSLLKIMNLDSSLELKRYASELSCILFSKSRVRAAPLASEFIEPLISLMQCNSVDVVLSSLQAFQNLLDDEQHAELAAAYDVVDLLVGFVAASNFPLTEASINALKKLGKDRPHCKIDMVKAGIIDNALEVLTVASGPLCSSIAELFRILTNNSIIAKNSDAARIVEPLFLMLHRTDFSMSGQQSALQALVNILEKPQSLSTLKLTPSQVIEPLISFLESPSQAIQQLGTELLSHLLEQEHFQQDITTKNAVVPLVQLAGIGILNLQQTAVKALESISLSWPKAVADAGGIYELSKVIIQDDPQPSHTLWESAALVLTNVLKVNSEYYFKVPLMVLIRLLHSRSESTITVVLTALIAYERHDTSTAILMAEAGAIDSLLDLLRSHQCEEAVGRLLEALFNNVRVREMKVSKYAIAPLSQYLLDPQTRSQPARLLATLALGDLFQHETLARASDAVSACRALVSLLEDQTTEDMKMVAICALQNLVMNSRTNRRAVAEAGGILVIQELLLSPNSEVSMQAALLIKFLFSNHTLQEYVSNELIRSLTAALEKELWATGTINEEVLRTMNVIFMNFSKLHISEAATLCIPHLVGALRAGNEAAQESVLDTLCLLKQSWSTMPIDIAKAQAMIAAEAIPVLQLLMKSCPPSFHERADSLLHCLPGCLTVTIKRGSNLKQAMGSTNAFCRLTIGNGPPRQTKVVNRSTCPEWKEGFTWAFDVPPKGQKLHILCKSKNTFGKTTLGRVTIQIDKVVTEGMYSGFFSLSHDGNRDGTSRTLEIEIIWSNRTDTESV